MESQPSSIYLQIPESLRSIVLGFAASQALFTACDFGIFDLLHDTKRPQTASQIKEKLPDDTYQSGLTRLLDTLVSLKILEKTTFVDPPLYENSSMTERFLVNKSPMSVMGWINGCSRQSYPMFANLGYAVKEGTCQWKRTSDKSPTEIWEYLYNTREALTKFHEWMNCLMKVEGPALLAAFDLSAFKQMCDIGGGTGCLGYEASKLYPDMKITVLDLAKVVEISEHFKPPAAEYPNQHNISFSVGDFFADELPKADLYAMARIMHDWGDEKLDLLLGKISKALPSGGGLLLGEKLLRDDKTGPLLGNLTSLAMLLFCESGARERSALEYKQLLGKHGFTNVQTRVTGAAFIDAILAIKS